MTDYMMTDIWMSDFWKNDFWSNDLKIITWETNGLKFLTYEATANQTEDSYDAYSGLPAIDAEWNTNIKNPMTWSTTHKWSRILLLTATNFVMCMSFTACEPALPSIMKSLNAESPSIQSLTISIYVLGYSIGPLFIAPISEHYGRVTILQPSYVVYLVSLAACGSSKGITMFIIFRATMGLAGVSFVLLGPAVIADIIPEGRRGLAICIMSMGPSVGPTLGIIAAHTAVRLLNRPRSNRRWLRLTNHWLEVDLLDHAPDPWSFLCLRETNSPVLQARYVTREGHLSPWKDDDKRRKMKAAFVRPLKMLFQSPIILTMSLYVILAHSYSYIIMATLGTVTQQVYGFTAGQSGLLYLGLTVGSLIAQVGLAVFSDSYVTDMAKRYHERKPEFRLPPLLIAAIILPLGLLVYGWVLEYHLHWIGVAVGMAVFSLGMQLSYLPVQMYLVDAFTEYAASAIAAITIPRSICSVLIPLGANPMYSKLGYGWGNSTLAVIAIAYVPFALYLCKYGERLRINPRFQPTF